MFCHNSVTIIKQIAMSDSEESISDIEVAANAAIQTLIPAKSRLLYELEYSKFEDWCAKKKVEGISEKVLLAYFSIKSEKEKPSSLWSHYSMLRCVISIKRKVDIGRFTQLLAFLKHKSEGYKATSPRSLISLQKKTYIDF